MRTETKTKIKTLDCENCQRDILSLPIGMEGTKRNGIKQYSAYQYQNGYSKEWFCSDLCFAQTYADEFTAIKEIKENFKMNCQTCSINKATTYCTNIGECCKDCYEEEHV